MKHLEFSPGNRCIVIAEIAQAHDGSLGFAHAHIEAAASAGADVVKFQTHIAEAETTPDEPWRVKFSPRAETRYQYWERMQFDEAEWAGLRSHALDRGMGFMSTPFSLEAVSLLDRIGVSAWKVASGEVTNIPMLQAMARTGRPVLISSGMSTMSELRQAVEVFDRSATQLALFQCTSRYPTPPEALGLNVLQELREEFGLPVGLSDHSATIYAGLAAAAQGADMIEVHIALSKHMFGPDVTSSLTVDELTELCEGVKFIHRAMSSRVDKDTVADEMAPMKQIFEKSVVARRPMPAGTVITGGDLAYKKPGTGIPAAEATSAIGKRLTRDVPKDHQFTNGDLAEPT